MPTLTISASVELFVFSFSLMKLQCTIPYPNYMQPSVRLFRSGCNPYASSSHVNKSFILSSNMILLSLIVCFRYCSTCLNLALSSLVLLVTLVHRSYIAGSMPVLPLFATHIIFQLYSVECPHLTFLFLWDYYQCCVNPSLPVMISPCLAPL